MTAVKAAHVDRAVAAGGADLLLFYGSDAGRIAERARHAARNAVDDPTNPFQLTRLDGDAVADEPGRLVEEATTIGLFGGRRAIWVRPTSRNIAPAVTACLDVALVDTVVVVEAGNLPKSSPLRQVCERSPRALALPCYADEDRDLAAVVTEGLKAHGLSLDPDARALLVDSLGGDRLASRSEIEKLALYVLGARTVTAADVEAVASDVSGVSYDAVLDTAYVGDREGLASALAHLEANGGSLAGVLPLAIKHGVTLLGHLTRLGDAARHADVAKVWPGLNFRRRDAAARQLRIWSEGALTDGVGRLQTASLEGRRTGSLAAIWASQALFSLAARAAAEARR